MRMIAFLVWVVVLAAAAVCVSQELSTSDQFAEADERHLFGQVLLPSGNGSRGVEVVATLEGAGSEPRDRWVLFDEQGHFSYTFSGSLVCVSISTGLRAELHRIEAEELPEMNKAGHFDVGVIDLRDRLVSHRLTIREAEGAPKGEVRVAMFFGPPPVGPSGEPVSLGSRQFPPVAPGSEVDWLLPHEAQEIFFLVERPVSSGNGWEWRGGHQQLFGPFTVADLPTELVME